MPIRPSTEPTQPDAPIEVPESPAPDLPAKAPAERPFDPPEP